MDASKNRSEISPSKFIMPSMKSAPKPKNPLPRMENTPDFSALQDRPPTEKEPYQTVF
jgi:hypothetical protein